MSKGSHMHTIRLPLRRICSALPAVALISGGILLPASAARTSDSHVGPVSKSSPAIIVPDIAMTLPGSSPVQAEFPMPPPKGPAYQAPAPAAPPLVSMLPPGTVPGSSALVTLDSTGIPVRALEGYRAAASLVSSADPACHIDWALVAGIGRVESNHARFGGNQLDAAGVAQPGIIGMALNGSNGTARISMPASTPMVMGSRTRRTSPTPPQRRRGTSAPAPVTSQTRLTFVRRSCATTTLTPTSAW
jgi:hypothetical protein